jgi:hypothetical protein
MKAGDYQMLLCVFTNYSSLDHIINNFRIDDIKKLLRVKFS